MFDKLFQDEEVTFLQSEVHNKTLKDKKSAEAMLKSLGADVEIIEVDEADIIENKNPVDVILENSKDLTIEEKYKIIALLHDDINKEKDADV